MSKNSVVQKRHVVLAADGAPLAELMADSPAIAAIKQRDRLIVGSAMKFPTFVYKNAATREYEGFLVDIAKALANKLLGDGTKVEWRYAAGTDGRGCTARFSRAHTDNASGSIGRLRRKPWR